MTLPIGSPAAKRTPRWSMGRHRPVTALVALALGAVASFGFGPVSSTAGAAPASSAGAATHLVVSAPPSLSSGDSVVLTVTAEDANGKVATSYTGTVGLNSTDPQFVPVAPSTLDNGVGTFTSTLATLGPQTVTARDTVTASISGTSAPVDVVRPKAVGVTVTGSSLAGVTAAPQSVTPAFSPATTDYVIACPAQTSNHLTFTLVAPAGSQITVGGTSGSSVSTTKTLRADQAVVFTAPTPGSATKTTQYWIRCLPPDFPTMKATVYKTPPSGWLLTGSGMPEPPGNYAIAMNSVGTPVWWRSTGSFAAADLQVLQNDTLAWAWGFADQNVFYDLNDGAYSSLATNAHELYQLPDGDLLTLTYPTTSGVDLTGIGDGANQAIDDCDVQEYTPQHKLVWSWLASQHISADESQRAQLLYPAWDVFHCNSIDVDPTSADPDNPNLLISFRNTNSVYYVVNPEAASGPGSVLWKIGGVAPLAGTPDATARYYKVAGDPAGTFTAQHDARFQSDGADVSLFDDGAAPLGSSSCTHAARGVEYHLNPTKLTATENWEYVTPTGLCANVEGSFRRSGNGTDNVVGWGTVNGEVLTEVNYHGDVLLNVTGCCGDAIYRATKVPPGSLDVNQLRQDMGGLTPAVTGVTPSSGPVTGGTVVTISGTGFTQATGVDFGGVPATAVSVDSDESITATSPPGASVGPADVTVTTGQGTSRTRPVDRFHYAAGG